MAGELSGILGHVDRIADLDLEGVEPTSHVVAAGERAARRRAVDEPAARGGARPGAGALRGRLPRPLAAGRRRLMADLLDLTVAEAAAKIAAGEISARGVRRRLARRRRGRRPERLPLARRRRRRPPATGTAAGESAPAGEGDRDPLRRRRPGARRLRPAGRRADRDQGHLRHRGHPDHRRLEDPRGLPAALHRDRRAQADRGRRPRARQDQHGRVRDGVLERELRLRAGAATPGTATASPAAPRAARRRSSRAGSPRRRSAPTPAARSASPPRSAASSG